MLPTNPCRYCVLLITSEDQEFRPGNQAFLDFAKANGKEVLRFAYVYQRQQQPLCQALLPNQQALSPQVSGMYPLTAQREDNLTSS